MRSVPTVATGQPVGGPVYRLLDRQTLALARLDERERIAMDLHDGVMQSLYAIGLGLATRERLLPSEDVAARGALGAAAAQVDELIGQMRDYVSDLRPRERAAPRLSDGLQRLARELGSTALVPTDVRLEAEGDVDSLVSPEVAGHLLYVAHEAVSNAIRHAQARTVLVRVCGGAGRLVLTVRDDGAGFDPGGADRQQGRPAGLGLGNMLARAARIGGALTIRSRPGHGTEVRLDIGADRGRARLGHAA